MKELTIEEKAKAYDEALERARNIRFGNPQSGTANTVCEEIFPELKEESEYERIRKQIVYAINKLNVPGSEKNKLLAWLEKQGEQKPTIEMKSAEESLGIDSETYNKIVDECIYGEQKPNYTTLVETGDGGINALVTGELPTNGCDYEQKPITKIPVSDELYEHIRNTCACIDDAINCNSIKDVRDYLAQAKTDANIALDMVRILLINNKPKFKVGDWITNGDYTWKIVEIKPLDYILQSQDGNIVDDTISHVDEQFHSFTIQDAKEGDVLYHENKYNGTEFIVMNKGINECGNIDSYFRYNSSNGFGIDIPSVLSVKCDNITPATKEQRDLLFQKMHEAGYEWDAEKKELKLLITNGGDFF